MFGGFQDRLQWKEREELQIMKKVAVNEMLNEADKQKLMGSMPMESNDRLESDLCPNKAISGSNAVWRFDFVQ